MLSPNRIFDVEVDRMKGSRISVAFYPIILFFIFILMIGSFGPHKLVIDNISNVYCEDDLHFLEDSEKAQNNDNQGNSENYQCIVCKDFRSFSRDKIANLRLEISTASEYLNQFEELETPFNISLFESQQLSASCHNLSHLTSRSSFPQIDFEKLAMSRKSFRNEGYWNLVLNNGLLTGAPVCDQSQNINGNPTCVTDIYGNMNLREISSNLAIMLRFPLSKEQKEKINGINFYLIFKNSAFSSFASSFQVGAIVVSLLTLAYVALKLAPLRPKDWLSIQKWILTLILTQVFLDNITSILSDHFESEILSTLNEIGENIHLALILYFWISIYDQILIQNMRGSVFFEWAEKIKVTLIGFLVILNLGYNLYIGIETLENEYKELISLRILLDCIKFLITLLQIAYGLYFSILVMLSMKLTMQDEPTIDKAWVVLFAFTAVTFLLMIISLGILYFFEEESFAYSAVQGFTGIYIIIIGILYAPHSLRLDKENSEVDLTKMGDRDQITSNADKTENSQEDKIDEKSLENSGEKPKQKMVWERINQEEDTPQPEKPIKEDSDNDEYIYL